MDVRRVTGGAGVVAALLVAVLVDVPAVAVAAGVAGATVAPAVDRGATGILAASLAVVAAALLAAAAAAGAGGAAAALVAILIAAGLAGCLAGALPAFEAGGERRESVGSVRGGPVAGLLGAWTALVLPVTAVLALLAVSSQPLGSLVASRLAVPALRPLLYAVPLAVAAVAAWAALGAWREAGLPPWLFTTGPAALLVGWAVLALPSPGLDALLAGVLADAPVGYLLLWAAATVLVASALAGAVAADDPRFRRGPAWVAVGAGPLALGGAVAAGEGGPFAGAALAAVPPVAEAFGAVVETVPTSTATAFLAALSLSGLAFAATLPARAPLVGELTTGRPAGVGAGCLLGAVALAGLAPVGTALAGGLAVLSWVLLAAEPQVTPPPRTALSRAGLATLAVGGGSLLAVALGDLVPPTDPGVGGALLLAGVATLGLAMR